MNIRKPLMLAAAAAIAALIAVSAWKAAAPRVGALRESGGLSGGAARAVAASRADRRGAQPIRIGAIGDWSGTNYPIRSYLRGIELAGKRLNEGRQGRPFEVVARDDKGSAALAKQHMQDFCMDPSLTAVIGGIDVSDFFALRPLAEFHRLPMVSPSLPHDRDRTSARNRFCFFIHPTTWESARAAREFMKRNRLVSVAILGPSDFYRSNYLGNAFDRSTPRHRFGSAGVVDRVALPVPVNAWFVRDTLLFWRDVIVYDTLLLAADKQTARIVFDVLASEDSPPVVVLYELITHRDLAGMDIPPNLTVRLLSSYDPADQKPANLEFIERYVHTYGEKPDWLAAKGYDAMNVIAEAVRAAGSTDPDRLAEALHGLDFTGNVSAAPSIAFESDGTSRHGRMVLLEPERL